jgi:hypothetical protein
MALSNTWDFDPSLGDYVIQAFHMCGMRPASLVQEHLVSARMAANFLLNRWASQGVNTWLVDLQTITLVDGTSSYSVPSDTIAMLDTYTVQGSGQSQINRILMPISRSEYAAYSNPNQTGQPSVFWFNRQLTAPTVTFYLTPDGTQSSVKYYRIRQAMDANLASGGTVEVPVYFDEAFCTGLAARLAVMWAPDRAVGLKALADEAYAVAANQNIETAAFYVSPAVQPYWTP